MSSPEELELQESFPARLDLLFTTRQVHPLLGLIACRSSIPGTPCNQVLTAPRGTFSTPGYPNKYAANEHCETLLSVEPGHILLINLVDVALESSAGCTADYVEIFDGMSAGKQDNRSELWPAIS